jgi:hypothetical protein
MAIYYYAGWRRIIFASILVTLAVVSMAPSVSQGTVTLRLYSVASRGVVDHAYVGFSKIELHETGFVNNTGWVQITKGFSIVDLVSTVNQTFPQPVTSAQVHSGRYDMVRVTFSNATLVLNGHSVAVASPSNLATNITVTVPPNSVADVLFVVNFDYLALLTQPPSLTLTLVQVKSV